MRAIISILLSFLFLSALGQASTVTFNDRNASLPSGHPDRQITAEIINELKAVINANATLLDLKATTAYIDDKIANTITNGVTTSAPNQDQVFDALATKQAVLSSGSNIKTVQGNSIVGSGDVDLIDDTATNGVTDKAPSQNYLFDQLALKANLTGFVFNEVPSGTINGSNVTFTLANTPTTGTFVLYIDGLAMTPTVDYSRSGTTITCVIAPSSAILAHYMK